MPALQPSLYLVDKTSGALRPLREWQTLGLEAIRNDPGTIKVVYPFGADGWADLDTAVSAQPLAVAEVETRLGPGPQGAMRHYLVQKAGDDASPSAPWTFDGHGLLWRFTKALLDVQPKTTANPKGELICAGWTAGQVLRTVVLQAQDRGVLTDFTMSFTATHDSAGQPWADVITAQNFAPKVTLAQIGDKLVEIGLIEWDATWDPVAGKVLHAWNSGGRGTDRTGGGTPLEFREAVNLKRRSRRESAADAATAVLAVGEEGLYEWASSPTAVAQLGWRAEVAVDAGQVATSAGVIARAQARLEQLRLGVAEYASAIVFRTDRPRPLLDYGLGDLAWAVTGTKRRAERISQIGLDFVRGTGASGRVVQADLVLDRLAALARRLDALTSGGTVVGTSEETNPPDTGIPLAPTGVVAGSAGYLVEGEVHSAVTVGWSAVTANVDGTPASDLDGYQVQFRYLTGDWVGIPEVGANTNQATFDATPDTDVQVRVRARDRNGNVSEWSTVVAHHTQGDDVAPPAPSNPTPSNWLGVLRIPWDGLDSDGLPMTVSASDLRYVEVHLSPAAAYTVDETTRVGQLFGPGEWAVTDLPYEVTQYAVLVAVDTSGNRSPQSAAVPATPKKLLGDDIFAGAVGSAALADAAVINAKIANLAVNDAKMANVSMGKVDAGQIKAAMIFTTGGLISSRASGSGLGWDGDSAGIRFYNSSNVKTIEFKAADGSALVTGTYQSGLSGERIIILPDGTFRLYGSSGTDYAQIANDGGIVRFRSRADGSGRRSFIDFNPTGLNGSWGFETGNRYSGFDFGVTYGVIRAPVCGVRMLTQFAPTDGTEHRFHVLHANASGDIGDTVWHFQRGADGRGILIGAGADVGIKPIGGVLHIIKGDGVTFAPSRGESFLETSSIQTKTNIKQARAALGRRAADVVRGARAKEWERNAPARRPKPGHQLRKVVTDAAGRARTELVDAEWEWAAPPPRRQFGPIAEEIEPLAPALVDTDPETGMKFLDLGGLASMAWEAAAEAHEDIDALTTRFDTLIARLEKLPGFRNSS